MNGPLNLGEDVALFLDWENFKISLATGRRTPNVSALKEEVSNLGRVVVAKAYADWVTRTPELKGASQFINDPPALYAAGIEPVYVPTRLFTGGAGSPHGHHVTVKNSVDVKMTADCIECAHSYPNIATFVLVSGDSDFIHVVNTLRTMGKRVFIIGVSWATSRRLADQVDGLILYDVDVDPVSAPEPAAISNGRPHSRSSGTAQPELGAVIKEIEDIVRSERHAGGTPLLTSIKQRLMRRFSGFDEKQLGFSGFKKLMSRAAQEGNIKLTTAGLVDWATMADEPAPSEADLRAGAARGQAATLKGRPSAAVPSKPEVEEPAASTDAAAGPEESTEISDGPAPAASLDSAPVQSEAALPAAKISPSLAALMSESTAHLQLPEVPGDQMDFDRISDLIVMADTLEHREGISHVAFNFLASEVCQALEQGLAAEQEEISQHWAQAYSKSYVSKMFRVLSDGDMFKRGWHSWRDDKSGRQRRRRTFNLAREHRVVEQVLKNRAPGDSGNSAEAVVTLAPDPVPPGPVPEEDYAPVSLVSLPGEPEPGEEKQDGRGKPEGSFLSRIFRAGA